MYIRYTFVMLISLLFAFTANSQEIKKTGGFARLSGMGANPFIVDPYDFKSGLGHVL